MNAMRLALGILFVFLASTACMPAMAEDVQQPSKVTDRPAAPSENRASLSDAEGERTSRARPDDRLQRALSVAAPVGAPAVPAPNRQESTAPSLTNSQDEGLGGCCLPACNDPCPSVYGQVEGLFLKREPRFARQPIVVDSFPGASTTLLSTSDLDFDFDPGVRATVGMRLCGGRALEFSYFGLWQGDASAVVEGPFLTLPGDVGGNVFLWMDRVQVNYSSWLHSFEVNLPCCCGCCDECGCGEVCQACGCSEARDECGGGTARCRSFEWFAGFRYLNLGEELNILGRGAVSGEYGTYNLRTANNLYGAQLGARWRRSQGPFGWEATGKAGIFGNDAQQTQTVEDYLQTIRPTVSSGGAGVAFVGEINLSALYRLTDVWNLKAGYNALWIEGLALAPDQLDFNFATAPSGTQLHHGGGLFLHGVNVGLEARW